MRINNPKQQVGDIIAELKQKMPDAPDTLIEDYAWLHFNELGWSKDTFLFWLAATSDSARTFGLAPRRNLAVFAMIAGIGTNLSFPNLLGVVVINSALAPSGRFPLRRRLRIGFASPACFFSIS